MKMQKQTLLWLALFGLLAFLPEAIHSAPQVAREQADSTPVIHKLGGLVLPYQGEANLGIVILRDEDGNVEETLLTVAVPAPADFSCQYIGWEFALGEVTGDLDFAKEPDWSGAALVYVQDKRLHIEIVSGETETKHHLVIPWQEGFAYDGNEFVQFAENLIVQTKVVAEAEPRSTECPGGRCSCGAGRCDACCSAGYHPLCRNCGANSQNCSCYKNRSDSTPETTMVVAEYATSPTH